MAVGDYTKIMSAVEFDILGYDALDNECYKGHLVH